jgi:hypothetical protein
MTSQLPIAPDGEVPLRGARRLALVAYGSCEESDIKRLYNEAPFLPVFRLKPKGPLLGYASQLRKHYAALATQAQARAAAGAAGAEGVVRAAEKEATTKAATKTAQPPMRHSRKTSVREAATPRKAPAREAAAPHKPPKAKSVAAE